MSSTRVGADIACLFGDRMSVQDDEATPRVSCDSAYMSDIGTLDTIPMLVIRDRTMKAYAATVFSWTGADQYAVQFFVVFFHA